MYAPTATHAGSLGDGPNGNLLSVDKVSTYDAFITDQWTYKRLGHQFVFDIQGCSHAITRYNI